jgi:hypothetical protein
MKAFNMRGFRSILCGATGILSSKTQPDLPLEAIRHVPFGIVPLPPKIQGSFPLTGDGHSSDPVDHTVPTALSQDPHCGNSQNS